MYTPKKAYFYGTGRRKSSIARVRLIPGGTLLQNAAFFAIEFSRRA